MFVLRPTCVQSSLRCPLIVGQTCPWFHSRIRASPNHAGQMCVDKILRNERWRSQPPVGTTS